jgi:tRNA (cmo5U34)-methyltransferase
MHDWHSDAYVREWVGAQRDDERATLARRMAHLIPFDPGAGIRVLDVGCGYGFLTRSVLEAFPNARVVLHDYSEPMLEEAERQLSVFPDAVAFARGDLMTPDWVESVPGEFDAVVSSIAIHNVRFPERIRAIYGEIFQLVAPGGCFLNLDRIESPGGLISAAERHAQLMVRRQERFAEMGRWYGLAEVEAELGSRRRPADIGAAATGAAGPIASREPATLVNQLRWLAEAGFSEVECFWRDGRRALIGGYRAGSRGS